MDETGDESCVPALTAATRPAKTPLPDDRSEIEDLSFAPLVPPEELTTRSELLCEDILS